MLTAAGAVRGAAPRVNDKRVDEATGERCRFPRPILPPWCRKSPKVSEVLPLMYLHGMSSGDFVPGVGAVPRFRRRAVAAVITRLTAAVAGRARRFADRSWPTCDYVYCWADGVHFNVRLEEDTVCLLVIVGVRADGTKELVALADGYRESTELGGPAAGLQAARDAGPGGDGRRRGAGLVVGAA